MFWTVVISSGIIVLFWKILQPKSRAILGVYKQPGRFYQLKKFAFWVIFQIRHYKNSKVKVSSKDMLDKNRGYGSGSDDIQRLESVCPLEENAYALDAVYFGGFNKDGARLALRIGRRHDRHAEIWMVLEIPGIGVLQHPVHPDTDIANTNGVDFTVGGLKVEMIEPMKRWKVTFNGLLRHGLCNLLENKPEKYLHTKFSFIWTSISDPFNFDTDINPTAISDAIAREDWTKEFWDRLKSKHQTHYEQWGELKGKLEVEGYDSQELKFKTVRDHSIGVRDWRSFHRYAIHFIFLENGTMIQTGVVSLPDTTSYLEVGYLIYPGGEVLSVSNVDLKLWEVAGGDTPSNEYYFTFTSGGTEFLVEVTGETTPEWYHHGDRGCKIYEKFCKYLVNGKKGYGLVEFCYRNKNGPEYTPKESLTLLKEPPKDEIVNLGAKWTLDFSSNGCCSSRLVGGKGAQLGMLSTIEKKIGAVVPNGFCITLKAFKTQIDNHQVLKAAIEKLESALRNESLNELQPLCTDVVNTILSCPLYDELESAVGSHITQIFGEEDFILAVRSSAAGEDGCEASSAGQLETFLGIRTKKEVFESVKKCWASAFTYQAVEYRRQHGQPFIVAVGVVIQEMVKSEVSGVLFTRDPVSGSSNRMTLDASYGLGEVVVSGKANPDSIKVRRTWDDQISIEEIKLGNKKVVMSVSQDGSGVEETETDASTECCLSDKNILRLCNICIQVEQYFGSPRDVEWAYAGDQFFLLQARPITTLDQETEDELLHELDDALVSDKEWLTRGNIGEMMPGAVSPLTSSIFQIAIDKALQSYAHIAAGAYSSKYAIRNLYMFAYHLFINMNHVGIIGIHNIYGIKEQAELNLLGESLPGLTTEEIREYAGRHKTFLDRLWIFLKYTLSSRRKMKTADVWMENVDTFSIGSDAMDAMSLYKCISEKIPDINEIWETTIVKSANSGVWAGAVVGIISGGKLEWTTETCADVAVLLSKCEEVYSAEVPSAIQDLAREIVNVNAAEEFLSADEKACVELLKTNKYSTLKHKFEDFMRRHGHRCVREAEFLERSWRVQPEKLVEVLKTILETKSYEVKDKEVLTINEAIKKIRSPVSWFGRLMLKFVILPRARNAVGQREWGKSVAVKFADVMKEAYWKLADLMVKEGRIPEKELLFFLTHTEIGRLLETRSPKLIKKSVKRRKLFPKAMDLKFSKFSVGVPRPIKTEDVSTQRKSTFSLKGMPVCQGSVTGTARVIHSLQEAKTIQSGDILIVSYTDVGWTPYFPLISGLVTEMGGLLSHGAVVAREYGLPCIVSVNDATQMFVSGDIIKLDGLAGTVSKLENENVTTS